MKVTLREAVATDIARIAALDRQLSPVYGDELSYRRLLGSSGLIVVAEAEGALAGFAAFTAVIDEATLLNLAVAEGARRRGCASKLLGFAAARLDARNLRRVLLEVRESNDAARTLYARCGFSEDGRRPAYYPGLAGGRREAAVLMSQSLSGLQKATAEPGA